jgi:hypothetical protein
LPFSRFLSLKTPIKAAITPQNTRKTHQTAVCTAQKHQKSGVCHPKTRENHKETHNSQKQAKTGLLELRLDKDGGLSRRSESVRDLKVELIVY